MNEKIEVGDPVMIVRWPCCGKQLGKIFTVAEFCPRHTIFACSCGYTRLVSSVVVWDGISKGIAAEINWLKKINPPQAEETRDVADEVMA